MTDADVLTPVDKVLFLQGVDIFRHTTPEMLTHIGSIAQEVHVKAGQVIFAEGDMADAMYVIVSGHVGFTKEGAEVMTLTESESFGAWALVDRQPRLMTAVAVDDLRLLRILSEDFYDLPSHHEDLTPAVFKSVIERIKSLVADSDATSREEITTSLVQSEKMASLGLLAANLSHEINTPLGAIHSNNDLLLGVVDRIRILTGPFLGAESEESKEVSRLLGIVEEVCRNSAVATERIMGVVQSLKNFVRLDEAEMKKADIREGLESTLALVQHELQNRIRVVKDYGDLPEIECFPNQLNQVFMNIIVNAAQAIEGNGEIAIKTWLEEESLKIAIRDTGGGIPAENLSRVFEPGFTTKGVGVGTGLGLSICYQIIQAHQGKIEVESSDKGTTFSITLPSKRLV